MVTIMDLRRLRLSVFDRLWYRYVWGKPNGHVYGYLVNNISVMQNSVYFRGGIEYLED